MSALWVTAREGSQFSAGNSDLSCKQGVLVYNLYCSSLFRLRKELVMVQLFSLLHSYFQSESPSLIFNTLGNLAVFLFKFLGLILVTYCTMSFLRLELASWHGNKIPLSRIKLQIWALVGIATPSHQYQISFCLQVALLETRYLQLTYQMDGCEIKIDMRSDK